MAAAPTQAVKAVSQGGPLCDHLVGRQRSVHLLTGDHDLDDDVPVAVSADDGHPDGPGPQAVCVRQQHPRLYQLWQVLHTNSLARWAWANFHICQSMLAATNTESQRQQVLAREQAFNQILADICAQYSRCRWDNKAVYNYQFSASQVSSLDFFHPSLSGQAALARVTWAASWWPSS